MFPFSKKRKPGPLDEASFKRLLRRFNTSNKRRLAFDLARILEVSGFPIKIGYYNASLDYDEEWEGINFENYVEKALNRKLNDDESFKVSVLSKIYSDAHIIDYIS